MITRSSLWTRSMPHMRSIKGHLGLPSLEIWALCEHLGLVVDELNALLWLTGGT